MRHGFAPVAAAKVGEVLARGELGARERGWGWRRGGVGRAAAGLAGEGAGVRPTRVHRATATADGDEIWWLIV
uniref:Uncharacterized protein n=1 Tax=Oryza punctata TaxID=4537 RepID=A0A0E0JPY0_ORYPU